MQNGFIFRYWENQVSQGKDKPEVSWGDVEMMRLETDAIRPYIKPGLRVLDAGCANGYSTSLLLQEDIPLKLTGFDYVPQMIREAEKRFKQRNFRKLNYTFYCADIRSIPEPEESFDRIYTIRVLINLPNWQEQIIALNELLRLLKPEGLLILSEAFWGSLQKLNALRAVSRLNSLKQHDFNRYLIEEELETFLTENKYDYRIHRFSSLYYLGTRFIRELNPDLPSGFHQEINRDFFELSKRYGGGDFGIQKQYIIRR